MDTSTLSSSMTGIILFSSIAGLVSLILGLIINWKIWSKAGFNGAMSLLMLIPIVNIIMIFVLAFGEWPVRRELEQLRAQMMARGPQYPQYPPQQRSGY